LDRSFLFKQHSLIIVSVF